MFMDEFPLVSFIRIRFGHVPWLPFPVSDSVLVQQHATKWALNHIDFLAFNIVGNTWDGLRAQTKVKFRQWGNVRDVQLSLGAGARKKRGLVQWLVFKWMQNLLPQLPLPQKEQHWLTVDRKTPNGLQITAHFFLFLPSVGAAERMGGGGCIFIFDWLNASEHL